MGKAIPFFLKNYKIYVANIILFSVLYALFEAVNIVALFPIINSLITSDMASGAKAGFVIKALSRVSYR